MVVLALLQALLRFTSEARWLRHARAHLRQLFPYLPQADWYNERVRRLGPTIAALVRVLTRDTTLGSDDVWVVGSTGRVRPLVRDRATTSAGRSRPPNTRWARSQPVGTKCPTR